MKFKQIIIVLVLALPIMKLSGQGRVMWTPIWYSVDKKVDLEVNKFPWIDTGTLKNSMTIKVSGESRKFNPFNQTLDCYTSSFLKNDTIYITGYMINHLGWGFALVLFKDSCIAGSYALSDGIMYKYDESDTASSSHILLPNVYQKLTLSKNPSFQIGEIISGAVDFKSITYYNTILKDNLKIEIKAYFKTAALKDSP